MSWQACRYAAEACTADPTLPRSARLVLMLTAERADRYDAQTYTGDWLCQAAGLHTANVRRALVELVDRGLIDLVHRSGRASIVRFPLAGTIDASYPQPGAAARGVDHNDPARNTTRPRVPARDTPRAGTRRTGLDTGDTAGAAVCTAPACPCDGTGWIWHEHDRTVSRCTTRTAS